jgi:hypothetical protein
MAPTPTELVAAALFALALVHTFSTKLFERLARAQPAHAGLWHLLGEVEVVFGLWAMVLVASIFALEGPKAATAYLDSRNFGEPLFVFAIMVVAGSRPILHLATLGVRALSRLLPVPDSVSTYFCVLALVPLLGSVITEPGAMTLAALMLRRRYFAHDLPPKLMYASLGVLFVNVSIGGTLTPFAAPPVLMVAGQWGWDLAYMLQHFGWRAALAVFVNALVVTVLFRAALAKVPATHDRDADAIPLTILGVNALFLLGVVVFAHHPPMFMGLFLFFMGYAQAYQRFQGRLILREALLVAFFLGGLVVLGALQQWWLRPLLQVMNEDALYYGATALTAITDNAALTYLGAQVEGLTEPFKYALVAGAVTGGGLTVIANAPNPAAFSILKGHFEDESISPLYLFLAALGPTCVAIAAFRLLP